MKRTNAKGYTIAEVVMSMMLVLLFGMLCFGLIQAGGSAYSRIALNRASKNSAMITLNYIETRLRQADSEGGIKITDNPFGDNNAIVIYNVQNLENKDLWICEKDGMLVEYYCDHGQKPQEELYTKVAEILDFDVVDYGSYIEITASYSYNGARRSQSRIVSIRSDIGGGLEYVG